MATRTAASTSKASKRATQEQARAKESTPSSEYLEDSVPAATPGIKCTREDVQAGPGFYVHNGKMIGGLKVDSARLSGKRAFIEGWSFGECDIFLELDGMRVEQQMLRKSRPDVADSLRASESGEGFGFSITAKLGEKRAGKFMLSCRTRSSGTSQLFRHRLIVGGADGMDRSAPLRAIGFLEAASTSFLTGDTVVVGWAVHGPGVKVWLENEEGDRYPLEATFRVRRQDVQDAHGNSFGHAARNAGFIARLGGMAPGERVKMMASDESEAAVLTLSETACGNLDATPTAAAQWLFGLGTPVNQLHARLPLIDVPVIEKLIQYEHESWKDLPIETRMLGPRPEVPLVSVIVPLFGRSDFVEHQLIEFARDEWFCKHAELIYVVDDPKMVDGFRALAEGLYRLYKVPFRWVWGGVNRGFSGANNLGAAHATAPQLLFLNSDAFPQEPGWLPHLLQVLDQRADVGAVAPRLVFADGSIQHAAMEFQRREELGVWINHHPFMGLDPALDPQKSLAIVPAVTGACLAIRRTDFDAIGGWDTGYLIGDFEDSDMCLKLRSVGKSIAYLPTVQLTHLERQSFRLLGQGEFRTKVVVYNAFRHQSRWGDVIESLTAASAGAS